MAILTDKKQINRFALLFTAAYMISYITRINYGAIISEMESATAISRSMLSMALTGSFITYGAGQIISGVLGDKYSPKKIMSAGLLLTTLMNLLLPLCEDPYLMLGVWCINGFAQSLMWPPLVKIVASLLSEEEYNRTIVKVSWGSSLGTIVVYLVSPLIISLSGWKTVFIFSACCSAVMLLLWHRYALDISTDSATTAAKRSEETSMATRMLFSPMMLLILLAIVFMGIVRDGTMTWMPSYISETYNLSNIVSILSGVILPIFSILCFQAVSFLYRKKFTNPIFCAAVVFGVGALAAVCLCLSSGKSTLLSLASLALLSGCMHGVNLMLISMVPAFFKRYGNVSTASGVINAFTYVGSAISSYGIALLSERSGWGATLLIWLLAAIGGTAICLACTLPWEKKFPKKKF